MGDFPTTDALIQLMIKAKAGDKNAFEALYTHCFLPVYRYIIRRVHHKTDAEDLAQAVFLNVYSSATPFQNNNTTPLAYLFTIARHKIIDFWKKTNQAITVPLGGDESEEKIVEETAEAVEKQVIIKAALKILPDEQRLVLENKFFAGLTTTEIAHQLQKSEMAVRQIQCRALRTLRAELAGLPLLKERGKG